MAGAIDRKWVWCDTKRVGLSVVVVVLCKLPVLDTVQSGSSDLHRSLFPNNRDRTFHVSWIGQHCDFDDANHTATKPQQRNPGILTFDASLESGRLGTDGFDR